MLIAIDIDGVVADLHTEWLRRINQLRDTPMTVEDVTHWQTLEPHTHYLYDRDLYEHVTAVPGSLEAIAHIRHLPAKHKIYFASSCVKGMIDQKINWLERHRFISGENRFYPDVVMASDKSLLRAEMLIDDGLHNFDGFGGPFKVLYDRPWNRETEGRKLIRRSGWPAILQLIEELDIIRSF